jgi:hypothetical protein
MDRAEQRGAYNYDHDTVIVEAGEVVRPGVICRSQHGRPGAFGCAGI